MHGAGAGILVVPATWDAASARIFQECGAKAIGTTSLGAANTLGYADGESYFPADEAIGMLRRIVDAVTVPVSGDIEAGYGDPEGTTEAVIEAGAVGLNIEDRVGDEPKPLSLEEAAARVAAVRKTADRLDFPLVINARTETLACGGDLDDAVKRLNTYLEAGADCALPILPAEHKTTETIRELVERVNGPINAPASAIELGMQELERLGVRRVSAMVYFAAQGLVHDMAQQLLTDGSLELMKAQKPFTAINEIFKQRPREEAPTS